MWRILQQDEPGDFVIATGATYSLQSFVEVAFGAFGLDWRDFVDEGKELLRPKDLLSSRADPSKAEIELQWRANHRMPDVVRGMIAGLTLPT
jgi:GDPmannose 4,6-dehydratase